MNFFLKINSRLDITQKICKTYFERNFGFTKQIILYIIETNFIAISEFTKYVRVQFMWRNYWWVAFNSMNLPSPHNNKKNNTLLYIITS